MLPTIGPWETISIPESKTDIAMVCILPLENQMDLPADGQLNNGQDLAQCYGPDQHANGRLMSAAPELLEALMLTVQYLDEPAGCTPEIVRDLEKFEALLTRVKKSQAGAISKARAAIAKATGN